MITQIDNKMIEMAETIGICDNEFKQLDTKSKVFAIKFFARLSGETEVEQMCQKMQVYLN